MNDDPSDKIEGQEPDDDDRGSEPRRLSFLDLFEQQIMASRVQAQATIAACDAALVTVGFMRVQLNAAERAATEGKAREQDKITKPATFGRRRREQAQTGGSDGDAKE